jgi:hypothetical protein
MNSGCGNLEKAPIPNAALVVVKGRQLGLLRIMNGSDANGKSGIFGVNLPLEGANPG